MLMDIDINGMESKPNLLKTLGTNYFKITHWNQNIYYKMLFLLFTSIM
jgi:hypothetical protein